MIPPKLRRGDCVRVIAPARSMALPWISKPIVDLAVKRFKTMGLKVSFGKNVNEIGAFDSSSLRSRLEDIHDAFEDKSVRMISTIMGGYNSNELLPFLDYGLIKRNPKILCGYSDITALENGIYAKTGLVTYSGPHFFDFGELKGFEYTQEYFKRCLFESKPYSIMASEKWSNDRWGKDQINRNFNRNEGHFTINEGEAKGKILISNLVTFQSLLGSEFAPGLNESILFIEEDKEESLVSFNRNLTSLTLQPDFSKVQGIIFGRFQPESQISKNDLMLVIRNNPMLQKIPIIGGVDFGHTTPRLTFPIGGEVGFACSKNKVEIHMLKH